MIHNYEHGKIKHRNPKKKKIVEDEYEYEYVVGKDFFLQEKGKYMYYQSTKGCYCYGYKYKRRSKNKKLTFN